MHLLAVRLYNLLYFVNFLRNNVCYCNGGIAFLQDYLSCYIYVFTYVKFKY